MHVFNLKALKFITYSNDWGSKMCTRLQNNMVVAILFVFYSKPAKVRFVVVICLQIFMQLK